MTIRKAKQEEWSSVQLLNNEVMINNAEYDPDIIKDWAYSDEGTKYFKEVVTDTSSVCLVMENDAGTLVGYIIAVPKPITYRKSRYLEIDNMGVLPEYRSKGIGYQLIEACKKWAEENKYQKLFVNSYSKNEKAIRFYKSCGFEMIDVSLEAELN